jgi:hypothetical protein
MKNRSQHLVPVHQNRLRTRDVVRNNGHSEHLEYVKEQSKFSVSSIQAPVIMGTKIPYNFRRVFYQL